MLVDGGEPDPLRSRQDVLGSVAVVDVEVEDADAVQSGGPRLQHGDGDGAEVAESHGVIAGRMVSGRTHQAQGGFALAGEFEGPKRGADSASGVVADAGEEGRVAVEILGHAQTFEMSGRMGTQQRGVRHRRGVGPLHRQRLLVPQQFGRALDARGFLGMPDGAVFGAARIVDDGHWGS